MCCCCLGRAGGDIVRRVGWCGACMRESPMSDSRAPNAECTHPFVPCIISTHRLAPVSHFNKPLIGAAACASPHLVSSWRSQPKWYRCRYWNCYQLQLSYRVRTHRARNRRLEYGREWDCRFPWLWAQQNVMRQCSDAIYQFIPRSTQCCSKKLDLGAVINVSD